MEQSPKILRLASLLCGAFLLSTASPAQAPPAQQQPRSELSTSELEAQPNTAAYPARQRPLPKPGPPTADQEAQPGNTQVPRYFRPAQSPPPTTSVPAATSAGTPAGTQMPGNSTVGNPSQNTASPGQRIIGPPAPPPPTPEQMPPTPARVTYQNGLLTIESTNSYLTDILTAVHRKAGIQFEGVQAGQDRVAGKFGPGPADEVLASLLRGSRFDYVIVGMPENPAVVQRVILTPNAAPATTAAAPGAQPPRPAPTDEEEGEEGEPQEQVQAPQQPQPGAVPHPVTGAARTQEQLVEELKAMQQQQQNQQQNPNQPTPNAPIKPPARRPINPQ